MLQGTLHLFLWLVWVTLFKAQNPKYKEIDFKSSYWPAGKQADNKSYIYRKWK